MWQAVCAAVGQAAVLHGGRSSRFAGWFSGLVSACANAFDLGLYLVCFLAQPECAAASSASVAPFENDIKRVAQVLAPGLVRGAVRAAGAVVEDTPHEGVDQHLEFGLVGVRPPALFAQLAAARVGGHVCPYLS